MKPADRRDVIAAYKERKVMAGIQNRLRFTLRQGNNPHRSLQEAWSFHGAEAFAFEVVETVPEADLQFGRDRALKRRLDHWVTAWGGTAL